MKGRFGAAALGALLFLTSCGGESMPESEPQPSVVKRPVATTSTTVSKGNDCNDTKLQEYWTENSFQSLSKNAKPEELRSLLMDERQRIRRLDLPTLQQEQKELVDSMEEMIIEITQAITTQRRSGKYDAALIRWTDAGEDFRKAYVRECEGL